MGGLEESATGILNELSKPLSWAMPAEKVCEKLKKKDAQICDLRYGIYTYDMKPMFQMFLMTNLIPTIQRNKSI